jgi:hypothetical protein
MLIMLARWVGQSAASTAWFFLLSPSRTPKRQVWLHTFYKRFRKQAIFLCDVWNEDKCYRRGSTENASTTDVSQASI